MINQQNVRRNDAHGKNVFPGIQTNVKELRLDIFG